MASRYTRDHWLDGSFETRLLEVLFPFTCKLSATGECLQQNRYSIISANLRRPGMRSCTAPLTGCVVVRHGWSGPSGDADGGNHDNEQELMQWLGQSWILDTTVTRQTIQLCMSFKTKHILLFPYYLHEAKQARSVGH